MRRSLFIKFILAYLAFGVLGFLLIALFSSRLIYAHLVKEQASGLYAEASFLAESYSDASNAALSEDLVREQMGAVSAFLHTEIWLVDRGGKILSDTAAVSMKGREIAGFDPTLSGNRLYTVGDYHGMFSEEMLSVAVPITQGYRTRGYVLIHLPMRDVLSSREKLLAILYLTGGILFVLSLLILVLFFFIVYRPLRAITEGATRYAEGDYRYRISLHAKDEMGYLAETLNFMSDEISKQDEYQRQFIANVSHDFRSPLTSIKGYLTAILDGTIPRELESKYLERLISETERLSKLTQSMLDQHSIDQAAFLNRANFDVNRAIRDVCGSFEMVCREKRITFSLTFDAKKEMVYADYPKIQQVLYNLVDNALKFCHEDSVISIHTGLRGQKVYVSVKDSGIGISKRDMAKIWDRFYKTDLSRGKDKRGAGLGLSIVKSIINAHGENIDCVSTEGVGTEFTFTLPVMQAMPESSEA